MSTTTDKSEIITDWAGNRYPASMLDGQESPNFDVHGARRDRALQSLGSLLQDEAKKLPLVGDKVRVTTNRKHKGKEGEVFWRGKDAFKRPSRYGSDLQRAMIDSMGRNDRLGIRMSDGSKFFVALPQVEKLPK